MINLWLRHTKRVSFFTNNNANAIVFNKHYVKTHIIKHIKSEIFFRMLSCELVIHLTWAIKDFNYLSVHLLCNQAGNSAVFTTIMYQQIKVKNIKNKRVWDAIFWYQHLLYLLTTAWLSSQYGRRASDWDDELPLLDNSSLLVL